MILNKQINHWIKFIHGLKLINYINPHSLSKYHYFKLQCHLIMMDNEIITLGENMMMRLELNFEKNHFGQQCKKNFKYCHGMNVTPLALLSKIL
jgi:hypothetical protein